MLDIYAGKTAREKIKQEGFHQDLFTSFLGASGGPKWFTLYGLDKYIFGEFFKNRTQELNVIGSSAGAFRAACFAQNDPVAAIERLAKYYAATVYSDKPSPEEISRTGVTLLAKVFGPTGAQEIIDNPIFKAHFVVAKSNGLVKFENKFLQMSGLLNSYIKNRISRKLLNKTYERFIFQSPKSTISLKDEHNFSTHSVDLTLENINDALLASGSIPLVMQGVKDISGAPKGMYRDGGIIDYHFDVEIENSDGLTLYPHFNSAPKAGWFDKSLNRQVNPKHYDNVVMVVPSDEFVNSLPYRKIPDREDFTKLTADERITYWHKVLEETEKLATCFDSFLKEQDTSKIMSLS